MTQLVECLRHMEEVRGSSPLLPTTIQESTAQCGVFCILRKRLRDSNGRTDGT